MYRTKLLTDPKTFFEYYSDREGLTGPVVLMGCLVLVGLATSSIYIDWLTRDLPQRVATNVVLVRLIAAGISGFFCSTGTLGSLRDRISRYLRVFRWRRVVS